MNSRATASLFIAGLFAACLFAGQGCTDSSSGSDFVRNVNVDYTGIYTGTGDHLVSQNSGAPIDSLNVVQSGAGLEAFDNNGLLWRGDLSRVNSDASSSFRLDGQTTSGEAAQIVGTLRGEGTTGSISGTYIESGVLGTVSGTASISEVSTNAPTGDTSSDTLAISPTGSQTLSIGQTRQFSASGGSGTYSWTISNRGVGTLSNSTGSQVTYSAIANGAQTVTVTSGNEAQSTSISQSGNITTGLDGLVF